MFQPRVQCEGRLSRDDDRARRHARRPVGARTFRAYLGEAKARLDRDRGRRADLRRKPRSDGVHAFRHGAPRLLRQRCSISAAKSEEHTSELQSLMRISYAVLRLEKKRNTGHITNTAYRHEP